MARTSEEKTIDRLLTLYLINECYETHNLRSLSETKLQKLVFLSEKKLIDQRIKALNYQFIRLLYPTYSSELNGDLTNFVRLGYLTEPWFGKTGRLDMIIEDFSEVFRRNKLLLGVINEVLDKYACVPTNRLVEMVYRMLWRRGRKFIRINDLDLGVRMLYPLKYEKAHAIFTVTEDELEDLNICLNPKISKELDRAFDDAKRGKLLSHEEVFR